MADKTRIRGITIEIGGDASGLNKELKSVNSDLKSTQSALKDVNKLLKLDPGNTELLSQKQRLLNTALDETKQKLALEKKALEEVAKNNGSGELQSQQDALQREIVDTESKVKSLEKELQEFGSVGKQQMIAVGEKLKEVGAKIEEVGQKMTMKFTVPIVAAFGVATNAASDYEENLSKIDVAFGDSADRVKEWANNAVEEFGLSKLAATSAASSFGALAKGVGASEAAAVDMAITLAGLTSDLASYFNTSTDVSAKALEGIFTGEAEALKKFGVVMTQTNLEAFATSIGKVYSEMSDVEKVTLRYQYVLAKTSDAQGDYSRTSDGFANSLRTFKAALEDLAVAFGEDILPIITPLIKGLTNVIKTIGDMPAPIRKAIVVAGLALAAIGPILVAIGSLISGIGSIITILPGLSAALGAGGLAGAATTGAGAVAGITTGLGGFALAAVGAAAAGAAVGFAIAAIVDHMPEIKQAAKKAIEGLKDQFAKAGTYIQNSKIGTQVTRVTNNMVSAFNTAGGGIKGALAAAMSGAATVVEIRTEHIRNTFKNGMATMQTVATNAGNNLRNTFNSSFNAVRQTISTAMTNVRSSITTELTAAQTKASTVSTSIKSDMTTAFNEAKTNATTKLTEVKTAFSSLQTNISSDASSIKTNVTSAFSDLKTNATQYLKDVSTNAKTQLDSIKTNANTALTDAQNKFQTFKTNAVSYLQDIKSAGSTNFTDLKNSVADSVSTIESKVKTAYSNVKTTLSSALKWDFSTNFKAPHFNVTGQFNVDRNTGKVTYPQIDVSWYKKAMQNGMILNGATIFGMMGDKFLGGGEAGREAVIGVNSLHDLVYKASANGNNALAQRVDVLTSLLMQYLPEIAEGQEVVLDSGALVGQLMPAMNRGLGLALS